VLAALSLVAADAGGFEAFVRTAFSSTVSPGVAIMPKHHGLFPGRSPRLAADLVVVVVVYLACN
jgi:hypothetical protein